jgi:hypothetical protein
VRIRGGVAAVAAVAACGLLAGCATKVTGHGALADPTAAPTTGAPGPAGTGLPNLPLPSGGAVPNPEIPDSPCDVLDKTEIKEQFGDDAVIDRRLDSCKITSAEGEFLSFNAYAALTLTYEKNHEDGRAVTIADRPAYIAQNDHYIIVGRSTSPDDRGILTCYVGFSGGSQLTGIQLATRLFEQLMPHYVY